MTPAEFIAAQHGGAAKLLARHTADENGRCRGCTTPGTGSPNGAWPCSIWRAANAARQMAS